MKAPLLIETARLILAQPQVTDAAAIFERYASDPDVTRFLGWRLSRSELVRAASAIRNPVIFGVNRLTE